MPERLRMYVEIGFNLGYLAVVWTLVAQMFLRRGALAAKDRRTGLRFLGAFALLALGDTGHVGFRALGYAAGDLGMTLRVAGADIGLVGVGALATATTVTLVYVALLFVWAARYERRLGVFEYVLLAAAVVRLALFFHPANAWNSVVPPQPFSLYRNVPLVVQGLGLAYLLLRDARRAGDRPFLWIGIWILVSYTFYLPVILWVQQVPAIGMLMIPKTLAYLGMAFTGRAALFPRARAAAAGEAPGPGLPAGSAR